MQKVDELSQNLFWNAFRIFSHDGLEDLLVPFIQLILFEQLHIFVLLLGLLVLLQNLHMGRLQCLILDLLDRLWCFQHGLSVSGDPSVIRVEHAVLVISCAVYVVF